MLMAMAHPPYYFMATITYGRSSYRPYQYTFTTLRVHIYLSVHSNGKMFKLDTAGNNTSFKVIESNIHNYKYNSALAVKSKEMGAKRSICRSPSSLCNGEKVSSGKMQKKREKLKVQCYRHMN